MNIPKGFKLGKQVFNSLMVGGNIRGCESAQIFLQCGSKTPEKDCHDTIALIPTGRDRNKLVDSLSDTTVVKFFQSHGWTIYGFDKEGTLCPVCKLKSNKTDDKDSQDNKGE